RLSVDVPPNFPSKVAQSHSRRQIWSQFSRRHLSGLSCSSLGGAPLSQRPPMPTPANRVFLIDGRNLGRKGPPPPPPERAGVEAYYRPGGTLSRMPPPGHLAMKDSDERVPRHPPPQIVVRSEGTVGPHGGPRVKSKVPANSRAEGFRSMRVVPQEGGGARFRTRREPPLMLGGRTGGARGEAGWSVVSARDEASPQILARLRVKNQMP
ncbi:hypothetical protein T484DRAFT_2341781, partial [Baffinella frigidus]